MRIMTGVLIAAAAREILESGRKKGGVRAMTALILEPCREVGDVRFLASGKAQMLMELRMGFVRFFGHL